MMPHPVLLAFLFGSSCALGVQLTGDRPLPENRPTSKNHATSKSGSPSKHKPPSGDHPLPKSRPLPENKSNSPSKGRTPPGNRTQSNPKSRSLPENKSSSPSKGRPLSGNRTQSNPKGRPLPENESSSSKGRPISGNRTQSDPKSPPATDGTEIGSVPYSLSSRDVPKDAKQLWIDIGAGEHPYATAPGTFVVLVEPDEKVSSELLSRFDKSEYCSVAKVWIGKDTNATNSMTLAAFIRALPMKRFNQRIAKLKIDVGGEEGVVVAKSAGNLLQKAELVEAASGKNSEKTKWEPLMTSLGFKLRECYPRTWTGGKIDYACLWGNEHLETMAR